MAKDYSSMSKDELLAERAEIEKALASLDERRRAEALAAAEAAAREHGFSLDDVMAAQKKSGKKNPPKYRNPDDHSQTWSGRGRQPGWIKDGLNSGKSLEDFAI